LTDRTYSPSPWRTTQMIRGLFSVPSRLSEAIRSSSVPAISPSSSFVHVAIVEVSVREVRAG
jgi:hypothetical protein